MAALIPLDTFYLAQVAALTDGSERPTKSPNYGGTVKTVNVQYTLLGTEAANDTLALAYLPKNVRLLRELSYVTSLDPGTTLTLDVGTTSDADIYADGIVLSAGGSVAFGSAVAGAAANLVPLVTTDNTLIQATIASANTLTAGVILYFTLTYTDFN